MVSIDSKAGGWGQELPRLRPTSQCHPGDPFSDWQPCNCDVLPQKPRPRTLLVYHLRSTFNQTFGVQLQDLSDVPFSLAN